MVGKSSKDRSSFLEKRFNVSPLLEASAGNRSIWPRLQGETMPPLIQLPRTKLSKNFAQFLLRSSGKSGRVFFFLFFPFFLLRRGGNTGELCQSCQRRDANAVLRPTTANCGIADLWRWRKIGNSSIERSTSGRLSLTRVQCSFARSNLWNSRAIPRQFLSIVVASGSFSLSVTLLASSLLFRRFRSVAFFLPSMRFFFRNFDNSRSLCRTLFELNYRRRSILAQHSLTKIVTHARSHYSTISFIQFLLDRQANFSISITSH